MLPSHFIFKIFSKGIHKTQGAITLKMKNQLRIWRQADRKMGWGIDNEEFEVFDASLPLPLTDHDRRQGFIGSALFYGFGDDGYGNADAVFSGRLA